MFGSRVSAVVPLAFLAFGCAAPEPGSVRELSTPPTPQPELPEPAGPASDASASAPALEEPPETDALGELTVPGFGPAVVVPAHTHTGPRPVLVAAHGAGDGPEAQCETWRRVVRGRAFILCPRGVRLTSDLRVPSGYFYRNHLELEREVLAAVDALARAFSGRADTERCVYTGYSQGATMGALMIVAHASRFPRLVLIEGGGHDWSRARVRAFVRKGGDRVLFACGVAGCNGAAQKAARLFQLEQVPARAEYVAGAGHVYDGEVLARVDAAFGWLLEGDERWLR